MITLAIIAVIIGINGTLAIHWQQKHNEYWLLLEGVYYLFNEGHWQRAKPDLDGMVLL